MEPRNDVCAFWRLSITAHRRSPSTPFPPPSAASKFLALLVALVALSTANAQTTLKATLTGVLSSTYTAVGAVTTETGLSTALAGFDFTATVDFSATEAAHITGVGKLAAAASSAGYEWKNFIDYYTSSDAVWKTYVGKATVSFDFKT